jgi:threonine dehydratase
VLVGLQVPASDDQLFDEFLASLGFPFVDESANPAYGLFLRA